MDIKQFRVAIVFVLVILIAGLLALPASAWEPMHYDPTYFSKIGSVEDGTAAAPAWTFKDDTDVGVYRVAANNLGFTTGGTLVLDLSTTAIDANNVPLTNVGAAGTDFSATGGLTLADALTVNSNATVTGTLGVTGIQTNAALLNANGGIAVDTNVVTVSGTTGQIAIAPLADADANNYDNGLYINHELVGLGTKDRFYGITIEMTRAAGYDTTNGDHDDAALKIRMINKATANAEGTVMRGIDVNVKNDNPNGAISNLYGASFTTQTDTGSPAAGNVSTSTALTAQITANAPITDSLIVADFRNFRQTATEPTIEYGVQIRNGNTSGTGIDRGLSFSSEAGTVGAFGYVIDMNDAEATTADIRLSQGETIDNLTDGKVKIGGILVGGAEGSAVFNSQHSVTAAEINAGHTLVTVPDTRIFRLVNIVAVPYGGNCGSVTSVDVKAGAVILASYAQANLTRSNYLDLTATGVTLLADGASFDPQTEDQDITVIKAGSDVDTCTGVMFNLSYALD